MANIKSAIKRIRQNEVRRLRNRAARSKVRSAVKLVTSSVSAVGEKAPTLQTVYRDAVRTLDKAVTKGVLHKNTVSRKKSRLARLINTSSKPA